MQATASDKTFHLKWNNHLQNLSQLFSAIYSSAALADVTLSCRDGMLKAHKLVLSACSPYFEQIFKDNPCKHPVVILKGIPFSEINLLVEFMYKGSVDVQELDLQSLMHTASELEIRGLAYEVRDNAAQLLNVNLNEFPPQYTSTATAYPQPRTDVERLKQIHLYQQQSMVRAEELKRKQRREEASTAHKAVNNILAAAVREMEATSTTSKMNSEEGQSQIKREAEEEPKAKKRVSFMTPEDERRELRAKLKKTQYTVRAGDQPAHDDGLGKLVISAVSGGGTESESGARPREVETPRGIKLVNISALKKLPSDDEDAGSLLQERVVREESDTETDTDSNSAQEPVKERPHVCDLCDLRFGRASHLNRHRLTHTGERPFTCGGCGRSFARSDKLRVHTKICERDDPTVDMSEEGGGRREGTSEVVSGMVRTTHRESSHLMFTPSGDVMLPPRSLSNSTPVLLNSTLDSSGSLDSDLLPTRRGRGRPRKTPLPLEPKIKKKRGRPPKNPIDDASFVGTPPGVSLGSVPQQLHITPAGHQMLMKRKRGRPPKHFFGMDTDGRPKENYNATNLPFGDFSYLTEMMYNQAGMYPPGLYPIAVDPARLDDDHHPPDVDLSCSSSDEDDPRPEPDENVPQPSNETEIMTVGECQILKLPTNGEDANDKEDEEMPQTSKALTITAITSVGDCTIQPVTSDAAS